MNKIDIKEKISNKLDKNIKYKLINDYIETINLDIIKDTELVINYNTNNKKYNIIITIPDKVKLKLYEKKKGENLKIQYIFNLNNESILNIKKFNNISNVKEKIVFNLDGEKSNLFYNFKTICKSNEKYDVIIYHNNSNTESIIKNNGINIEKGKLDFNVSSFIPKGKKNCNASQINKIINLSNNKCNINPNLYIDEYDVNANHSAYIGGFDKDKLFYLQSRGISHKEAEYLLIKSLLLNDLEYNNKEELEKEINEYWR